MKYLTFGNKDLTTPFFSSECFFSVNKDIAIPSKVTSFVTHDHLGDIIQTEVSIEGRLIITLERDRKTLKIWYNDYEIKENGVASPESLAKTHASSPFQPMGDGHESPNNRKTMMMNSMKKFNQKQGFKVKSLKDLDEL